MRNEEPRRGPCGKVLYSRSSAKVVRRSGITKGKRMRIYWCGECRANHLTKAAE